MSNPVFVIDIPSCVGCYACSIACKDRAGLPDDLDLLRVTQNEVGVYPETRLYYKVIHCFHCADPSCLDACPVQAISKAENGLVLIDEEKCTGCGKCVKACPFDTVVILPGKKAQKCDGCADEVADGLPPACVRACPMRAMKYEPIAGQLPAKRIPDTAFDDQGIGPAVLYLQRDRKVK